MEAVDCKELRRLNPRAGRGRRRCTIEVLERVLSKPPPTLERVDDLETYKLLDDGSRGRRVCGHHRLIGLPSIVPEGILNPYHVSDPYEQYRCTAAAGRGVPYLRGLGPCRMHRPIHLRNERLAAVYISQKLARGQHSEGVVAGSTSLEEAIKEAQANMTVGELLDGTRLLWEVEALRQMAKDAMAANSIDENGEPLYDSDRAAHIAGLVSRLVDIRLKMVKTDSELVNNQAISSIMRVVLNGVVGIVEAQLGPSAAAKVLQEFKQKLLIPMNNHGFSEVLRRQEAAGLTAISIAANDFHVGDE